MRAAWFAVVCVVGLIDGACATAPKHADGDVAATGAGVVCGNASWQAMGAALEARCAVVTAANEARTCGVLQASWGTCPADIRPASRLRDHFTDELIVMVDVGGEWLGAVFGRSTGSWQVVAFDGGDIP